MFIASASNKAAKRNKALPGSENLTTLILVTMDAIRFCLNRKMLCGVKNRGMAIQMINMDPISKPI